MSGRWNENTTVKFVTEYVKHECLWRIKSDTYRDRSAKQKAYEDVKKVMNIPGFAEKEIKQKIKNIRSTYSQELKKIKDSVKSGCSADSIYVPSIKWYQILDNVLRGSNIEMRQTQSNLVSIQVLFCVVIKISTCLIL